MGPPAKNKLPDHYTGLALFFWHSIYPDEMKKYHRTPCIVMGPDAEMPQGNRALHTTVLFCDGYINNFVHTMSLRLY